MRLHTRLPQPCLSQTRVPQTGLFQARLLLPVLALALLAGCDSTDEAGTTTLRGSVVEQGSTRGVAGATVQVIGTGESTATGADGTFSLAVQADSTGDMISLEIFALGYERTTLEVAAAIDREVAALIELRSTSTGNGGGGGDGGDGDGGDTGGGDTGGGIDEGADEPSGPAASITLVGRSSETIGVVSAGADETATLTFVVLDAAGNPVDAEHAVDVSFAIGSGPGGGEFAAPAVKPTDASGRVQTTLSSGTRAGAVQLVATATNEDGDEIRSLPTVITITGGLPDDLHFSIAPGNQGSSNFPGYVRFGQVNPITAYVGDIYGNPVQPGTAVYFTTDAGIIEGSGTTDALGITTVSLISAAPLTTGEPPPDCPDSDARGYALITARTADMNQQQIEATTPILFSGQARIRDLTPVDIDTDTGLGDYSFIVDDSFGHPLAPETTISVIADGVNVEAVGDSDVTLGDYLCPGDGRTSFNFSAVQGEQVDDFGNPIPPELETLTIRVRSPNGNVQLTAFAVGGGLLEIVVENV